MGDPIRILILQDVAADGFRINHKLQEAGLHFRSKPVDSKQEFLHELEHHPPDGMLSDHGLPSFDRFTALAIAREQCQEVPFIFVTGSMGEPKTREPLQRGATDHVLKSRFGDLAPAVERALRKAKDRSRHQKTETALRETDERFRSVMEDIPDYANFTLDREGRVTFWNAGAQPMSQLIDALLAFSRTGRAELRKVTVNLAALIEEAPHELRRDIEGRDIEWRIGSLPKMRGDPVRLRLVVINLFSNALKFARSRRRAVIKAGSTTEGGKPVYVIRDNGVGFDLHSVGKLFGVFQRLHPTEGVAP